MSRCASRPTRQAPEVSWADHFIEGDDAPAAAALGGVAGRIGLAHEAERGIGFAPDAGDAGARPDLVFAAGPGEDQGADGAHDLFGDEAAIGERTAFEDHGELVAADAGGQIDAAATVADGLGDLAQEGVAGGVTGRIVDRLEVIEVDIDEHVFALAAAGRVDGGGEGPVEGGAVGQTRQLVVGGRMGELALQAPALGDVLEDEDHAAPGFPRKSDRRRGAADVAQEAIAAHHAALVLVAQGPAVGEALLGRTAQRAAVGLVAELEDVGNEPAQGLGGGNAGQVLGGGIDEGDDAVFVGRDHAVGHGFEGHPQALLLARQFLLDGLEVGDVGVGAQGADRIAVFVPFDRATAAHDPDVAAVPGHLAIDEGLEVIIATILLLDRGQDMRKIVGVDAGGPAVLMVPADFFVGRNAAHDAPHAGVEHGVVADVVIPDTLRALSRAKFQRLSE